MGTQTRPQGIAEDPGEAVSVKTSLSENLNEMNFFTKIKKRIGECTLSIHAEKRLFTRDLFVRRGRRRRRVIFYILSINLALRISVIA